MSRVAANEGSERMTGMAALLRTVAERQHLRHPSGPQLCRGPVQTERQLHRRVHVEEETVSQTITHEEDKEG